MNTQKQVESQRRRQPQERPAPPCVPQWLHSRGSSAPAPFVEYLDPAKEPPPINKNIILLTRNGVCVIGRWVPGGGYIGWLPMPKPTGEMTVKVSQAGF